MGQSVKNPYSGIVSIFSTLILNDKQPLVYEDGQQTRDFTYVADNVEAQMLVMRHPKAKWQAYNVSTGIATTIDDVVGILAREYGKPEITPNHPGKYRLMDARHLILDSSKLRALGWEPKFSVEEGVRAQTEWIKSLGPLEEYFSATMNKQESSSFVRASTA